VITFELSRERQSWDDRAVFAEPASIATDRLLLRPWRASDRAPFAALNADPRVMEWFPSLLTAEVSDRMAEVIDARLREQGWGLWACEVPGVADFIGFVGLNPAQETLGYESVEIGWRLAAEYWGRGYAPEAALASLVFGFDTLGLGEAVAFTSTGNAKSRRVMDKIGMTHDPGRDFDHPRVPDGPLRRQVLYRITREEFEAERRG
jgi:3-dehydroquinate dehydratase/shikimate dehydrogenase